MTVAATGPRGIAMEKLVAMVSQSSTFQTRVGAGSATAALPFIHYPYLDDVDSLSRPFALVTTGPLRSQRGSTDRSVFSGSFKLYISDVVQSDNASDAEMIFCNFADGLIDDLVNTLSGVDANLIIQATDEEIPPSLSDPRKSTDKTQDRPFYTCVHRIDWAPYLV